MNELTLSRLNRLFNNLIQTPNPPTRQQLKSIHKEIMEVLSLIDTSDIDKDEAKHLNSAISKFKDYEASINVNQDLSYLLVQMTMEASYIYDSVIINFEK